MVKRKTGSASQELEKAASASGTSPRRMESEMPRSTGTSTSPR